MAYRYQRRGSGGTLLLVGGVLVVGVAATLGVLWSMGKVELPFLTRNTAPRTQPPGTVAVVMSGRTISGYTQITRDHIWDPRAQQLAIAWLSPAEVERSGVLRRPADVIGRVLIHTKPAGYVFTEADFLPRGTRPGLVAGIPPGKRGLRVPVSKIEGLVGLNPGDRFDLVSTMPVESNRRAPSGISGAMGKQIQIQSALSQLERQATVSVIVQNGHIVSSLITRAVPTTASSLTEGQVERSFAVQEMMIAVDPDEVALVTEALALASRITCVPRSGHPDDPTDEGTPGLRRIPSLTMGGGPTGSSDLGRAEGGGAGFSLIETIGGSQRDLQAVPRSR